MFVKTQLKTIMKKLSFLFSLFILLSAFTCENEPLDSEIDASDSGNLNCEAAAQEVATAALAFISAGEGDYPQLCSAYKTALENLLAACGDPDGSIQSSIDALGDCSDPNGFDDCEALANATNLAEVNFNNATDDNYSDYCIAYKLALENQIAECGDDDGSLQAIVDDLGDCNNSSPVSNAEFYITGLFNGESIIMEIGTSDNYLTGDGSGFSVLDFEDDNCIIGYHGTLASSLPFNQLPAANINFDYFYNGGCNYTNETSVFNSIFTVGSYDALNDEGNLEQGMHMEYYPTGLEGGWYTSASGDQSNSQFQITNSESANYTLSNGNEVYRQIVTGTFNCVLYDSNGNSIEVTEGTFRVRFSQYFN